MLTTNSLENCFEIGPSCWYSKQMSVQPGKLIISEEVARGQLPDLSLYSNHSFNKRPEQAKSGCYLCPLVTSSEYN